MQCLVAFLENAHTVLAYRALHYISICGSYLASGRLNHAIAKQHSYTANSSNTFGISWESWSKNPMYPALSGDDLLVFKLWWPLLLGVSLRVGDDRLQVRLRALETLQNVLYIYGNKFSQPAWTLIFRYVGGVGTHLSLLAR